MMITTELEDFIVLLLRPLRFNVADHIPKVVVCIPGVTTCTDWLLCC